MKLTPLDIRHKEFHRGMRGYADAEVDEFLDGVADEFERVFKENIELSERLDSLQAQLDHYRGIEGTLQKTLVSAQQSAEEQRAAAQREAQLVLRDAEVKARDTLSQAYSAKQSVEREIVMLRNAEADFRFKFRALLEGYLKQLTAAEAGARERAGEFERQARALRDAITESGQRPAATAAQPAPATAAAVTGQPAGQRAAGGPADLHADVPAATTQPPSGAPATSGPSSPSASPPGPGQVSRPLPEPSAPQPPGQRTAAAPQPADAADAEDTAVLEEPEAPRPQSAEEEDDFFADIDDRVGGNEFKW